MIQTRNAERMQHVTLPNEAVGDIIILLLRGDNFDTTIEILSLLIKSPHLVIGTLSTDCINQTFELCLKQAHVPAIFVSI